MYGTRLRVSYYPYTKNYENILFLKFTDELHAIRPGIFIKKINRFKLDFMLSSQRHRE